MSARLQERRGVSQERIHAILLDRSRRFERVVRLKGGDPFVFGRGGEEAEALQAAGVDIEVVPGVTSAVAAPAAAGIPVTLRGESSGFTVVTAHQDPTTDTKLDWDCLARSGTTLVILMGAAQAARISDRLRAGGMPPSTPTAVVRAATTSRQRVDRTTLEGLSSLEVVSPSVIVIGAVAARDVLVAASGVGVLGLPGIGDVAPEAGIGMPTVDAPSQQRPLAPREPKAHIADDRGPSTQDPCAYCLETRDGSPDLPISEATDSVNDLQYPYVGQESRILGDSALRRGLSLEGALK